MCASCQSVNMAEQSSFVGARLRVSSSEGNYEGTVHSIDTEKRKLTLTKVVSCSTGRRLHGFHHFFGHELSNVELLDQPDINCNQQTNDGKNDITKKDERAPEKKPESSNSHHSKPASYKPDVKFGEGRGRGIRKAFKDAGIGINTKLGLKKMAVSSGSLSRDVSDEGASLLKRQPIEAEKYLSDVISDDDEKENLSPDDIPSTVVIDAFGGQFEEAVKFISKQRVIGVCCEGVNLGRFGKLCWLVIGCSRVIYLFDVLTLGAPCFDEGLQDILESGDILKVIHDCRQVSDALYHQYRVRLVNVFDTQVADVMIYKKEKGGELPRYVNGIVACLYEYLNVSPDQVNFQKVRLQYMQRKESVWAERPSPAALVDAAARHVMYLRELRLAQMERLLAEFLFGVNIYLSVVRDAKDVNPKMKGQLLPSKFHSLNQFSYRQRARPYDGDFNEDTINGVPEDVLANREAWNEGQEFADKYENKKGRVKERKLGPAPSAVSRLRQSFQDIASGSDSEASNTSTEGNGFTMKPLAQDLEEAVAARPIVKSTPVTVPPLPPQTLFTEYDFPPLSSSESEGPGSPPRPSAMTNARKQQSRLQTEMGSATNGVLAREPGLANAPGADRVSPHRASGLLRETAVLPGRGRAGALLRHAAMPALRLPAEDAPFGGGYEMTRNKFQFPADDELLAAPEIIPIPRHQMSGGTQVRIRQT